MAPFQRDLRVCRRLPCVSCNFSQQSLPEKLNRDFPGPSLVPPLGCAVSGKEGSHSTNRAQAEREGQQKEGPHHQVVPRLRVDSSACQERTEASPCALSRQLTGQPRPVLSCFHATHVSKVSISFVLIRGTGGNFQSISVS